MDPSDYYIIRVNGNGLPGGVQWSIPMGARAIIRPAPANGATVTLSDGSGGFFNLLPQNAASGYIEEVILPSGYPKPLFLFASVGDGIVIWCMPCGGDY